MHGQIVGVKKYRTYPPHLCASMCIQDAPGNQFFLDLSLVIESLTTQNPVRPLRCAVRNGRRFSLKQKALHMWEALHRWFLKPTAQK